MPSKMFKMYMSDHGHTLMGRFHTIMKIQQEKIAPYDCQSLMSYYRFNELLFQIIDQYGIDEQVLCDRVVTIQDVCYYNADYIKTYIKNDMFSADHLMGYNGVATEKDLLIRYDNGVELYQKHNNDQKMVTDERLHYLRSLIRDSVINIETNDKFAYSRIVYLAEARCQKRTSHIERAKRDIIIKLFEEMGNECIAIRGGGECTLRLLMLLPYNLRKKVKYVIDWDINCNAGNMGIIVIKPSEIGRFSINKVVIPSFYYRQLWKDELNQFPNIVCVDLYEELELKGIVCDREFYKKIFIRDDFIEIRDRGEV